MINLIPTPQKYELNEKSTVQVPFRIFTEEESWKRGCEIFADSFFLMHDHKLSFTRGGIAVNRDDSLPKDAYVIDCNNGINVYASESEGALYALASLLQLLDVGRDMISVPEMHIEDQPEKGYRAFMADLSGYWHPFEKLLRFVDICFMYKVNHLHLHFVDNKLYTLPSKAYPKLMKAGQYYTEEQIRYLNAYAKERGVVLVPEYECPGHAPVMVFAYPELFADTFEKEIYSDYYDEQGNLIETFYLMCAGSEACMEANKVLLKEISDLFPDSPYIHIGGDEANIKLWDSCSVCKKYMQEHQIEDVYELYSDFIGRVAEYVISLGKIPMVWEGFPRKGAHRVPKETIVIAWESMYHLPQDLVEEGFQII